MIYVNFYVAKARQKELLHEARTLRQQKQAGSQKQSNKASLAAINNFLHAIKDKSLNIVNQKRVSFEQ